MQFIASLAMKDHNTDFNGLKGGLEVINFLTLAQQGHNLLDPWAIRVLLFAGHISKTLRLSLPGLDKAR